MTHETIVAIEALLDRLHELIDDISDECNSFAHTFESDHVEVIDDLSGKATDAMMQFEEKFRLKQHLDREQARKDAIERSVKRD